MITEDDLKKMSLEELNLELVKINKLIEDNFNQFEILENSKFVVEDFIFKLEEKL